jgi:epoxyqueuosine reductase
VVSALIEVWEPEPPRPAGAVGRLPRYAWGDPYARLRTALARVREALRGDGARAAVFVDHNMHVDRAGGHAAGLTFSGKNTMAIAPGLGSFVAMGAVITDAPLVAAAPAAVRDGCGSCTLCIDACPTDALDEPGVLDATRCLSYWTQSRADAPEDVAAALEDRVYGCDICQDVCPWNTGAERRAEGLEPDAVDDAFPLLDEWLEAEPDELAERYRRLYVPDRDGRRLARNARAALANVTARSQS